MIRPLWKEKSLVEQDVRTQRGLSFVFLLVTLLSIWRKWQKTHCIHSLLVWAEWLKCGGLLHRGAIRVKCLFVCLVLWSACGSPRWFTPSPCFEEKTVQGCCGRFKKKSVECSILGKFQMFSEGVSVAGGLCFRIVTRVECWGQWTLELSLQGVSKLLGQAGVIDVHSGRLSDSSSGKALPTKAWPGSRETNGVSRALRGWYQLYYSQARRGSRREWKCGHTRQIHCFQVL